MANITNMVISEALKRGKAEKLKEEIEYIRFREEFRGIERGTVITKDRIIRGFPHIKRIFTIENGLGRNMPCEELWAEEKIDGFNVRIAGIDGRVCAFSRGGFLDTFVTEKARGMGLERFFKSHPEHVLCGEMIGNTPYTAPTDAFDVKLFIFDIDKGDGTLMPCEERYSILKKFGMTSVPVLGRFRCDDHAALRKLALALNKGRKEGMVLKSTGREHAVKYVTPFSDIEDIANASATFFDMPIGFYYQRVLRSAFFINDFGLDREEYAAKLGKAFYAGLENAIKQTKEGREIDEEFEILIRDEHIWDGIHRHMSRDVRTEIIWKREENGKTRIRFRKVYKKTTKTLASYAAGKGVTD